ncbi:lipoyl(octanoyl) transferase LipB [Gluconobacter wancherniae]|uniref:lipoyl(octanoyl) transferase LipB n=1 Tax=Gluconobacter wancherniae TaxID=1307955 RepID=UPI001B8BCE71|nr:lipoyl(octanoyl) transferase LipB [Gluconobacter wancherniae]MBS1094093.1 lipoyl(octanoyl) transferase LipB [Gluconobacter wancherniae]
MVETRAIAVSDFCEEILWKTNERLTPYPDALEFMAEKSRKIREGSASPIVWLVEHPPVFTAGTSAKADDLYNPHGYPTYDAGRGGQWTYHGPGQRLAYVMLDLAHPNGPTPPKDLRAFVKSLENWVIASLAQLGIAAFTREGRIGVWTVDPQSGLEAKIGALGIRVSRWVSWHGVSINVDPALDDFDGIVPCGIREFGVTSISRFNPSLTMQDLDSALLQCWSQFFGSTPKEI